MARLEDMEIFVAVVEAGSISAAAERLGMTKSAVSRRLTELETRLGAQLLRRTTRRLTLTDSGREFQARCTGILADVREAEEAVSNDQCALQGRLRIAAPLSFGLLHLAPAIDAFMTAHPGIEFDLDFNDRAVDLIAEGIDVAVRIARLQDSNLIARRLAPIRSCVCASPAYLARHGTPRTPDELRDHACLCYTHAADPLLWEFVDRHGAHTSVRVRPRLLANNGSFLCETAAAGQGITIQPTFIAHSFIARGELVPLLTEYQWPEINAYAVYPQTRHLSRRARVFVDFLVERFAGTPYWDAGLTDAQRKPGDFG